VTSRSIETLLWAGAVAALCAGGSSARRLNAEVRAPRAVATARVPALPEHRDPDSLLAAIEVIAEGNLFRPDRSRPDSVPAAPLAAGPPPPPAPPKAPLKLRGLIGGPPWDALIEGIPGHEGAVVARVGQTLGGITIRAVRRDTVIAQGMDTTWKLTLARSW
jgi:hypothetical protein